MTFCHSWMYMWLKYTVCEIEKNEIVSFCIHFFILMVVLQLCVTNIWRRFEFLKLIMHAELKCILHGNFKYSLRENIFGINWLIFGNWNIMLEYNYKNTKETCIYLKVRIRIIKFLLSLEAKKLVYMFLFTCNRISRNKNEWKSF